ncbi:MAG: hypothetical protein B6U72_06335 [Candidatus Altiarchaeales archaeon ex4484_2]|nr:MAG: hypothetical protein B6U72_06335 [Candidatus Altiarchaeales archaeon ex4484_2]
MKNKRIRAFMDRYPEFMLALTILTILFIVFSTSVSPESYKNASPDKVTATTTTSNLRAGYGPYSTSNCYYRCTDSDGGSVYERGYVSIVSPSGCPTTTARDFQDYCIDESTLMEYDCDKENRYHTQKQINCECSNGACIVGDYVDVTVTPSVKYVSVGDKAIYKIKIRDKHPLLDCDTSEVDESTTTSNTEEIRCKVYHTYNLSVLGLPFTADYPQEVMIYQGRSKTVELTIQPEYQGRFTFTVTATQNKDQTLSGSDSATLVVNGYTSCDEACQERGYEYGVCRTSCNSDERNLGTRYCIQEYISVKNADVVSTTKVQAVALNATAEVASTSGGEGVGAATAETREVQLYRPIYCCCGVRELKVKAWTNKNTYESGETARIYAKVAYTDDSNIDSTVYGTVTKPDGSEEDITFMQVCAIQEIKAAVTDVEEEVEEAESIETEIQCDSGICNPRCIYLSNYKNTETEGRYKVTVRALTPGGEEVQTKTYFNVIRPHITCEQYCQEEGYDYGICRGSCIDDEYDTGSDYCYQEIHPALRCCCGKLTPPQPPQEKIKLHLKRGWNLITMPGKGELDKGTCERMYGFIYIDGRYYTMDEAEEKLGSEELMEYLRLHSFWIYAFKSCYLEFSVEDYTSYSEVNLDEGWNFVPVTRDMKSMTLDDIKRNCELEKTYMWNPIKQSWEKIDGVYVFKENDLYHGFISYAVEECGFSQTMLSPPALPQG